MFKSPSVLIIGQNHAMNFDLEDEDESDRIIKHFSEQIPNENTFKEHNQKFANELKKTIDEVEKEFPKFKLTYNWLGTNRCAIQANKDNFIEKIKKHKNFKLCQEEMDELLLCLIKFIKPQNIILTGKYACELFYTEKKLSEMKPKKEENFPTNLIPLMHFSYSSHRKENIKRLKDAINDGYLTLNN